MIKNMVEENLVQVICNALLHYFFEKNATQVQMNVALEPKSTSVTIVGNIKLTPRDLDMLEILNHSRRVPEYDYYGTFIGENIVEASDFDGLCSIVDSADYTYDGSKLTLHILRKVA